MVTEHKHYRGFLRATLSDRRGRNSSYSLRAFARALDVPASHLSMILNDKAHLSPERAAQVADHLELEGSEREYFLLLVEYEQTAHPDTRSTLEERLRELAGQKAPHDISTDTFKLISDWYHFPLLMMTEIPGERLTRESVAARLGITKFEAEAGMERLERLGMLKRQPDGRATRWQESARAESKTPNPALRKFHLQMLKKAEEAVEEQSPQERYIGSETVAIAPEHLSIVHEEMARFRSNLVARISEATRETKPSEIYHLNLNFFRVSNPVTPNPINQENPQ